MALQIVQPDRRKKSTGGFVGFRVPVVICEFERQVQLGSQRLQNFDAGIDNFGPDAVGGDHGDFVRRHFLYS